MWTWIRELREDSPRKRVKRAEKALTGMPVGVLNGLLIVDALDRMKALNYAWTKRDEIWWRETLIYRLTCDGLKMIQILQAMEFIK